MKTCIYLLAYLLSMDDTAEGKAGFTLLESLTGQGVIARGHLSIDQSLYEKLGLNSYLQYESKNNNFYGKVGPYYQFNQYFRSQFMFEKVNQFNYNDSRLGVSLEVKLW